MPTFGFENVFEKEEVLTKEQLQDVIDIKQDGTLGLKTSAISQAASAADVQALPDTTEYGATIELDISTDDKLVATLKSQNDVELSSAEVDFPLDKLQEKIDADHPISVEFVTGAISASNANDHDHNANQITTGNLAIARGGTGAGSATVAINNLLGGLESQSSAIADSDSFVRQRSNENYVKTPMSAVSNWMIAKTDSMYINKTKITASNREPLASDGQVGDFWFVYEG